MKFEEWLLQETKYHNDNSMTCGHCHKKLTGHRIEPNHKHIYIYGQMFLCLCKKSRVWTNSIRNEDDLMACFANATKEYRRGFCNDTFCGYCKRYLQPLKNGYVYGGKRLDLWGCEHCPGNQLILVNGRDKDPEGSQSTAKLFDRYKQRQDYLKAVIDADNIDDELDKTVFWKRYSDRKKT